MAKENNDKKILAAIGYPIWIIAVVLAIIEKDDKYVKYHAYQATFFGLGALAVYIAMWIVGMVLIFIPFLGYIWWMLTSLLMLALFVLSIIYAIKTAKGEMFEIPFITKVMKNFVKSI